MLTKFQASHAKFGGATCGALRVQLPFLGSRVRAAIQDRVRDEQLVLDELARLNETDPLLGGRLDLEHVGAFGFSLSGATSAELCRVDTRCRAGANMDGAFLTDNLLQQGLSRPFMIVRADGLDPASATDDRKQVYNRLANTAYWVKLTNTVHGSFWENSLILDPMTFQQRNNKPSPIQTGIRTSQIARAYLVSFFNKHLKGVDDHLLDGPSPEFPEVMEFLKK